MGHTMSRSVHPNLTYNTYEKKSNVILMFVTGEEFCLSHILIEWIDWSRPSGMFDHNLIIGAPIVCFVICDGTCYFKGAMIKSVYCIMKRLQF